MHVIRTDISSLAARGFETLAQRRRPVIIEGGVKHSHAFARWSPAYFKQKTPELRILAKRFEQGKILQRVLPMAEYVDLMQTVDDAGRHADWYCHDVPIFALIPGLERDVVG